MRFVRKRNTFAKMNAESYQCFSNEVYSSFGYDNYVLYAYQYTIFFVPYELWTGMPEYGPNTECSESGILPEYQQCEPQVDEYGYGRFQNTMHMGRFQNTMDMDRMQIYMDMDHMKIHMNMGQTQKMSDLGHK
ncbi:uncharacterized protein LOC111620240 [Centruroides sculpturatus]|uniref:uncharacterized protein LOC111620240 n=1 Tax=Centruroides sculpturatus TaxID=218467 RepID=UPI000C6ED28F|nr:uncharacterized protein LOC111620240 [Centruroides sculpturatus]